MQQLKTAETFELLYAASSSINFAAFDYRSVKQSLIDYIRIYHAEAFSDYIESSELIAIIESFAYVCELISYRLDMNAHENTMDTAKRKDMVLKLARMACYNASRVNAASGLVKVESITTTEKLVDSKGKSLANTTIRWNDTTNTMWREQFFTVFNRLSRDQFGSVSPQRRVQVGSVLYELYDMIFSAGERGVVPISVSTNGKNIGYELVPADITSVGPTERRPSTNGVFSLLYAEDGLGDNSDSTGMFMLIKQGTLYKTVHQLDAIVDYQTIEVDKPNVNNTDIWLNQITTTDTIQWTNDTSVDTNIAYSISGERNRYTVDTLQDDKVRLIFGNDEFSNKPSGKFDLWFRTSDATPTYIPKTAILRKSATFTYSDDTGRTQTATLTYSLVESIQNGSTSETVDHIKRHASLVYSSQNRMVNARDYNVYPLKDPSILKVKTVNRTFAGESLIKTTSSDPSGSYDSVKVFDDDGTIYEDIVYQTVKVPTSLTPAYVISNHLEPVLSQIPLLTMLVQTSRMTNVTMRTRFNDGEIANLVGMFNQVTPPWPIGIKYVTDTWVPTRNYTNSDWDIMIDVTPSLEYRIVVKGLELVFSSDKVEFYASNDGAKVFDVSTAKSQLDTVKLIKANTLYRNEERMFTQDKEYRVLNNRRMITGLYDNGQLDGSKLTITTMSATGDYVPSDISQYDIMDQLISVPAGVSVFTVNPYSIGLNGIECSQPYVESSYTIVSVNGGGYITVSLNGLDCRGAGQILKQGSNYFYVATASVDVASDTAVLGLSVPSEHTYTISPHAAIVTGSVYPIGITSNKVTVNANAPTTMRIKGFVYSKMVNGVNTIRGSEAMDEWAAQYAEYPIRRLRGRSGLNFVWKHYVTDSILVNPSPTNIQDMFVLTASHMANVRSWLSGNLSEQPTPPSTIYLHGTYQNILNKAMMSDSVIMKSGNVKILFGSKASEELRAQFYVVRTQNTRKTDNTIKRDIVDLVSDFFSNDRVEFGKTFFFSELENHVMSALATDISSFVLVPSYDGFVYGDLQQILARGDEILFGHIEPSDIAIVQNITPMILKR